MNGTTTCPRCNETFGPLDEMRFRAGKFAEELDDDMTVIYDELCEDCHREVVRS